MEFGLKNGKSLWWYVLPLTLVSIVLLLILGLYSTSQLANQEQENIAQQTRVMVNSLADRLAEILRAKQETLRVVAGTSRIIAALRGDQSTRDKAIEPIKAVLPDLIRLRLYSSYFDDVVSDIHGVAPIGYAGIDIVKRAMRGQPTPAEVHQISSGSPYLATAVPVKIGSEIKGVLFAAWSISLVKNAIHPTPRFPGKLHILQKSTNNYVLAANQPEKLDEPIRHVAINGTIWDIAYNQSPPQWNILGLLTFLVILISVLLSAAGLQFSLLNRDVWYDLQRLLASAKYINIKGCSKSSTFRLAPTNKLINALPEDKRQQAAPTQAKPITRRASRNNIPPHIFRAYDIRGVFDSELNAEITYLLGQAFAEQIKQQAINKVYVAYDARLSSPELVQALQQGLLEQGVDVANLGMSPVALLYYMMHQDKQSGAIMVSGSHNPPQYNGFKLYMRTEPLMDSSALLGRMIKADFPEVSRGQQVQMDIREEYLKSIEIKTPCDLKIVVDAGNGAAGELVCDLLKQQGAEVIPLYCEPDGNFPNHHPDPNQPENLVNLSTQVTDVSADLGMAFDGDGDRISLVDNSGEIVRPEHVFMLLAADLLQRHPQARIVYDVKSSAHLAEYIIEQGGEPVLCRSGYTRIWHKMRETEAMLGGEFTGHYFMREDWPGTDDAIYVAARLVDIISQQTGTLAEQLAALPKSPSTPEYQMLLKEGEAMPILQAFEKQLPPDSKVTRIDGLKIEFGDAWGLVRSSNTLPSLSFRFEADDEVKLNKVKRKFHEILKKIAPDKKVPF